MPFARRLRKGFLKHLALEPERMDGDDREISRESYTI
jgi:hypothetical protein